MKPICAGRIAALLFLAGPLLRTAVAEPETQDQPAKPGYPATLSGLQKCIEDILAAAKAKDKEKLDERIKALSLPNFDAWFLWAFGPEKGELLATDYEAFLREFEPLMGEQFTQAVEQGRTIVRVRRIDVAGISAATRQQVVALSVMKEAVPLYSVWLHKPGEPAGRHMWSFVHAEGSFRFIGTLPPLEPPAPPATQKSDE